MSINFDHRSLAGEMEIFFFDEQIGPGLPVWLPNGVALREELESFVKLLERKAGYQRVVSPHLAKGSLYQMSGHLRAFNENMYPPMKGDENEGDYYLRPMNCPHHHKVFSALPRSYRQLPLRIAEYGQVYRYENSGALKGLSRVRGLCQNDAHIYVDSKDSAREISAVLDLHEKCYRILDLKGYRYRLSKHDPLQMQNFDGEIADWVMAEEILRDCLIEKSLPFYESVGDAAFYGPKIDVQMPMGSGGEESIASIQLDFNSAEKFGLGYVASNGEKQKPWIIHRAPLGSHERFVALLLEYYEGRLPGWLSPIQVYLLPIGEKQKKYCEDLQMELMEANLRVQLDLNSGSLSKRLVFAHKLRPFVKIIIGDNEIKSDQVKLQFREDEKLVSRSEVVEILKHSLRPPEF